MTNHTHLPLPPRRKVKVENEDKAVDYGLLKSMIRDEVDLQVKRQVKEIIQPIYQVIMADDRFANSIPSLPQWLQQLVEENNTSEEDIPFFLRDDNDPWR